MAKARTCIRDRAVTAFKRAFPAYEHNIRTHKVRSKSLIRVYGSTTRDTIRACWSYDGGSLKRVVE